MVLVKKIRLKKKLSLVNRKIRNRKLIILLLSLKVQW
ncbi:hypothetical protein XAP412_1010034 [Xanthomonas phaseoli pv. phaseoli]|uniref:Uncharacterized protein n=1 Tax=Xanthomonas campestris pv. phaseoli TaxID=317013 RepID=A0AB38DV83_XANCH|nr:hypothetical protein XAP412_1010034 [Xanthomonas phaseoli pv. phaseoli]SON75812.1 hypothetical protein XAP6984_1060006 [Xanthomonas phaseoli pv. phaseoli]SON77265.1 hypothetical protein XAP7430_1040006 [Xanthomonas phaseoli pv. phaseoli]